MYIIAIGYAYVIGLVVLVSLFNGQWLQGVFVFVLLGMLPLWVFMKSVPRRRIHQTVGKAASRPDGENAKQDQ